jgi:hypothetical protein
MRQEPPTPKTTEETDVVSVRMPRWLRDHLKQMAAAEDRSLNGEIVHVLREQVQAWMRKRTRHGRDE